MLLGVQVTGTTGLGFFLFSICLCAMKIEGLCSTRLTFYGRNVCMCYHVIIYKPPTSAPPVVICEDFCLLKVLVHLICMYCLFCHNEDLYSGTHVITAGDISFVV